MRKFLILSLLISAFSFANKINTIEPKIGFDISSKAIEKIPNDKIKYTKRGYEIGIEYRREFTDNFELGAGISYRSNNSYEKNKVFGIPMIEQFQNNPNQGEYEYSYENYSKIKSIPIYATARYNFKNSSEFTPYVKANLGYSFNHGKNKILEQYASIAPDHSAFEFEKYEIEQKIKSGAYYGIGAGVTYKNFLIDLSYNITNLNFNNRIFESQQSGVSSNIDAAHTLTSDVSEKYKIKHKMLTLSFGYQFKF